MEEKISVYQIEELIMKIQGVISTKVVVDEDNIIQELHLLTDNTRNPKQISRDIQSALAAELNIDIDHKVISIAQIEFTKDNFLRKRVKIQKITKTLRKDEVTCEVHLKFDEREEAGVYKQKNISFRKDYAIVMATIRALEKLFKFEDCIFIDDIQIINHLDYSVAVVLVSTLFLEEEKLSGSSVITDDRNMSLVKATLDAVNRRINML